MSRLLRKIFVAFACLIVIGEAMGPVFAVGYDSNAPLLVKRVEFCQDRPKGLGRFEQKTSNEFRTADDKIYLYIELANCKQRRKENYFYTRLALDIDIYYEDGVCVFSERDVNVFDCRSARRRDNAYMWTKIDATYLREGEYKIEMTVRDETTDKEAFCLTRFKKMEAPVKQAN
jgi:hypothetical protein